MQCFKAETRGLMVLVCSCAVLAGFGTAAAGDFALKAGASRVAVAPGLAVYRDPGGAMTLEQARQAFRDGRFEASQRPWPAFGFTSDAVWVRFAVHDESGATRLWLTELRSARMDELDWYLLREGGEIEHLVAGNLREASPGMVGAMVPVFPLRLAAGERAEVFLRVYSETSLHLPLQLWDAESFIQTQSVSEAAYAAFFGYLAALIFLSLMLSLFIRARGFLIYALSIICLFVMYFITSGYYGWLQLPGLRFAVHGGVILAAGLAETMLLVYLREFFDLPAVHPRLDRWIVRVIWGLPVSIVIFMLGSYRIMDPLLLLQALLLGAGSLAVSLQAWWRGNSVARFYALAWLVFWALFALSTFEYLGWLPMPTLPELQAMSGVLVSTTLFFLAMADRVRQIRSNMVQAQAQVLDMERQASHSLQVQMQQQQQLIRDLHDGIGGLTANVAILAEIGRRGATVAAERGCFERIAELATESGAEVSTLMNSMEAREILWPEFIVQCRKHGHLVLAGHGIEFDLTVSGECEDVDFGLFAGMSLFRVFKEVLNNAVKHSRASRVDARFEFTRNGLRLTLHDNGCGFGGGRQAGRGLTNMASRIAELGGTMTRGSGPGTEWVFELPLPVAALTEQPPV
jgi:signal transduction histidine kinase